jgi:hypothetical protein
MFNLSKDTIILCVLIFFLIIVVFYSDRFYSSVLVTEHYDAVMEERSNEALQSIVTVYNKDNMIVTNMTSNTLTTPLVKSTADLTLTGNNIILTGNVCSGGVCMSAPAFMQTLSRLNKMDYIYSSDPSNYVVYQDILAALSSDPNNLTPTHPIAKYGNPGGYDSTSYTSRNLLVNRTLLSIGSGNGPLKGLIVSVPPGMSVIWMRPLNDRWFTTTVYDLQQTSYGTFAWGKRNLNTLSPDGGTADGPFAYHTWMPIALPINTTPAGPLNTYRKFVLVNGRGDTDGWISGIAFSTNPWNHASTGCLTHWWRLNGDSALAGWNDNWNNDPFVSIQAGAVSTILVPVVPSGKDKIIYLIDHNNNWQTSAHTKIMVNGQPVERLKTTYSNPISHHFNSKPWSRYIGARVPASLIPSNSSLVTLTIDLTYQARSEAPNPAIRESGTHDAY